MSYVRNAWYVAAWEQDWSGATPLSVNILGEAIVLWKAGDRVVAFEDRCVHRSAPLSLGRCEGKALRCMYHGLLFDETGACVEIPGQETVPPKARVKTYPTITKHSWIWVWMGDAQSADENLVPPAIGFDDPEYIFGHGYLDYEAEAQLINDNLLDFSHLSYVHAESFGAGPAFAEAVPKLETLPRGVRFSRWITGTPGPVGRNTDELVDSYMSYDFLIPGILLMWNGSFAAGTASKYNFEKPDYSEAKAGVTFTNQAVTPTGDRKARYFFSWGPHRHHGDENLRDFLMDLAGRAFGEDKVMIEAQQKVLDRSSSRSIMPTAHDRGVTIFSRLVERLARGETEAEMGQAAKTA